MSRTTTIKIDANRFTAVINELIKERHFKSWSDICEDMAVNHDLLASAVRKEKVSARTAKLLERFYKITPEQYTPINEGIFEEPQETRSDDISEKIAAGIIKALSDVKTQQFIYEIITSAINDAGFVEDLEKGEA